MWQPQNSIIHFVGIGGIGISGIAKLMHGLGYKVQGSDIAANSNTKRLADMGIKIFISHKPENAATASCVVISSAVNKENPEVAHAIANKIPVISRSQMLAELMRLKTSIAISGSHGKTTTTSMVANLFKHNNLNPTVCIGGIMNDTDANAYLGSSQYFIVEADESDATFIKIPASIAVITNIDPEHLDFYHSFDNLLSSFKTFITNLPFYGFAVCCLDHERVSALVQQTHERKIITYGIDNEQAQVRAVNIKYYDYHSVFDVVANLNSNRILIESLTLSVPGKHNILNNLAAISIGLELDFGVKSLVESARSFNGVQRRFTKIASFQGADVIDDYAHHPEEIKATLAAAKLIARNRSSKVLSVFQPHRYTRLRDLFEHFALSFQDADVVYITDVYSAGEERIDGFSAQHLVDEINQIQRSCSANKTRLARYLPLTQEDILLALTSDVEEQDVVVMMGAGNISNFVKQLFHV
ncbi:UDP-N-acetylmuramate--L-alanine ligase [Rickettsiales endosymbiont of Paramecium tredecaurelia]|uniref:UDP-N-acetylmuramate--L-alanine ligase n=1 Tax=Candidatus Sarmatiella mevalonica TaxID=2770581 RepID=UPI001920B406|nr:UDP-N-acetylmuramate--L-alanine ligase [Candidatus Sarmatiella mevalonica]MBL3285094.1 UDP-N-acetylmuramate--L-alanine ligase [Candidatus Sarmatiella mevalonica]